MVKVLLKFLKDFGYLKKCCIVKLVKNLMVHLFISFRLFMIIKLYLNFLNGMIKVTSIEYLKC